MNYSELVTKILDQLAEEHGSETFVSSGYAYYDDAHTAFTEALAKAVADELVNRHSLHPKPSCNDSEGEPKQ